MPLDKVEWEKCAEEGQAAAAIVHQAKHMKADMIVMGIHGRSALRHMLLGSVAEKVVRTVPCPVLTIRPEAFQFELPDETKEELMKNAVGLWIDHRKAVIVVVTYKGEETKLIISKVEKQLRRSGDSPLKGPYEAQQVPLDDSREKDFTRHLNIYYDAVIACVFVKQIPF